MGNISNFALQINSDICCECMECVATCNFGALSLGDSITVDELSCRLCGACVEVCPSDAITLPVAGERSADQSRGIWVLADIQDGVVTAVTLELLGEAVRLSKDSGDKVSVVVVSDKVSSFAKDLIAYGADTVHLVENEIFMQNIDEHVTDVVADLAVKYNPNIILVAATEGGRGVSARLAAKLKTGLTADCTMLRYDMSERLLLQCRPAFGGNIMATIKTPNHRPQMASVRPGVMKQLDKDISRQGEVIIHDYSKFSFDCRKRVISQSVVSKSVVNLDDCKVLIGIGRGVKSLDLVAEIEEFATKIGAIVVGSRAAVELGFVDVSRQVGQTGHTVAPDLYIALGISGQIQHTAAITGSKCIIAINQDSSSPIFNYADYGWVGTIEEFLPELERMFNC